MKRKAAFVILVCLIAAGASAMLLPKLAMRPMHTDEAVHAWKLGESIEGPGYRYDPNEYHGPTLNFMTLPVALARGERTYVSLDEVTLRLVPALCGIALVLAVLLLFDGLGGWAVAAAALLTAISPAMSYYSRYFIMEVPLVLFTFLLIAGGYRYARSGHLAWAVFAGAAAGLMYATKETWVLAIAAMTVALVVTAFWQRYVEARGRATDDQPPHSLEIRRRLLNWRIAVAVAAWAAVAVVFFSSFFTNWRGPLDAVLTYVHAASRAVGGTAEGGNLHTHPWYFYLRSLFWTNYPGRGPVWTELLIGVLAVVGIAAGFTRRGLGRADGRLVRFLSVYTVVLMVIYSVLPYKTPWCVLSPLHGMILLAGVGAAALVRWMPRTWLKAGMCVLLAAGAAHLGYLAWQTNYRYYDSRRNPWVYAHTSSGAIKLADRVKEIAALDPAGMHMRINVFTPDPHDQWPLPWYLRRFDRVAYYATVPARPDAAVLIFPNEVWAALRDRLRDGYHYNHFGLRPGVVLNVGVRDDLWQKFRDEVLVKRTIVRGRGTAATSKGSNDD